MGSRYVRLDAPCKVNLTLDVGRRRDDGFHDLDSVVALLYPADTLTVYAEDKPRRVTLRCTDPSLPSGEKNLAHRAATAFLESFGLDGDIRIELQKALPAEAGLGGGSSDAAAVLLALRRLFPGVADDDSLRAVGASIGSDVPLFLRGSSFVRMTGRGEIVAPLPPVLPNLSGVIVRPDVGVSTARAYGLLDALPDRLPGTATARLLDAASRGDAAGVVDALGNDFEPVVTEAYPEVGQAHRALREAGAVRALLCGSGSAVFGLARDNEHAREMADALRNRFPWVRAAFGAER